MSRLGKAIVFSIVVLALLLCCFVCLMERENMKDIKGKGSSDLKVKVVLNQDIHVLSQNLEALDEGGIKKLSKYNMNNSDYTEMQTIYLLLLDCFLSKKTNINEYQMLIDNSVYNFPAEDDCETRQGMHNRKNIAIRNVPHVEKLNLKDIELIRKKYVNGQITVDNELLGLVERTFKDIIIFRCDNESKTYDVLYNEGVFSAISVPNNALVLEICYEFEYDEKGNIINREIEKKKMEYLDGLKDLMEKEMEQSLGIPVVVVY